MICATFFVYFSNYSNSANGYIIGVFQQINRHIKRLSDKSAMSDSLNQIKSLLLIDLFLQMLAVNTIPAIIQWFTHFVPRKLDSQRLHLIVLQII